MNPVVTPALERAAESLAFVSSFGGPILVMNASDASRWWGCLDEAGQFVEGQESTDYGLACAVQKEVEILEVPQKAPDDPTSHCIVLGTPDMAAFHPLDGGLMIVRWVGADSNAGLLAAALALPDAAYETVGELRLETLWMFDSTQDGREPESIENGLEIFELRPGRYRVLASREWEGEVRTATGSEEVMVNAIRVIPVTEGPR